MEHEPQLPPSTQLAPTLAGLAVVGLASGFSGGLALLGLAGLFVYLAATSRPELDHGVPLTAPDAGGTVSPEPSFGAPPCPSPALESGRRWREAVHARRGAASSRSTSL